MTVFTVLLAVVFTGMQPQPLQTPDSNRIEEVRVSGNRRIPTDTIKYNVLTLAPFFDLGNAWVLKKDQLARQVLNNQGQLVKEPVTFLAGTNSGFRTSTGMELQILLPLINVPFRVIYAINPNRLNRDFVGPATGAQFGIHEKFNDFKFTIGRTF
jgi:outer membrane protein assembly factor BamA